MLLFCSKSNNVCGGATNINPNWNALGLQFGAALCMFRNSFMLQINIINYIREGLILVPPATALTRVVLCSPHRRRTRGAKQVVVATLVPTCMFRVSVLWKFFAAAVTTLLFVMRFVSLNISNCFQLLSIPIEVYENMSNRPSSRPSAECCRRHKDYPWPFNSNR